MASELIEMGKARPAYVRKAGINAARTSFACQAAGGIPVFRKGRFYTCRTPATWIRRSWGAKVAGASVGKRGKKGKKSKGYRVVHQVVRKSRMGEFSLGQYGLAGDSMYGVKVFGSAFVANTAANTASYVYYRYLGSKWGMGLDAGVTALGLGTLYLGRKNPFLFGAGIGLALEGANTLGYLIAKLFPAKAGAVVEGRRIGAGLSPDLERRILEKEKLLQGRLGQFLTPQDYADVNKAMSRASVSGPRRPAQISGGAVAPANMASYNSPWAGAVGV